MLLSRNKMTCQHTEPGGAHGVVLDLKAGTSAPPLFGPRHFPVELAGLLAFLWCVCKGATFSCALPVAFFGHPNQAAVQNGHRRPPSVKKIVLRGESPGPGEATSLFPCPCSVSFRPTSLRASHFPYFRLATSHRHHVPTREMPRPASYFRVCLFTFIFHAPPFRRVRHSQCMRMSCGMPRFSFRSGNRTFRMPNCFWRWRGTPSCVLSPPGLP